MIHRVWLQKHVSIYGCVPEHVASTTHASPSTANTSLSLYSVSLCVRHSSPATLIAELRGEILSNLNPFAWQLILTYTHRSSTPKYVDEMNIYLRIFSIETEWFRVQSVDAPAGNEYSQIFMHDAHSDHTVWSIHITFCEMPQVKMERNKKEKRQLARHHDGMTSK